jgi:pyruvate formate lyase activating enzyme
VWFEITNLLTPGRTTPKPATLTRGREIATRNGVRYAYTGNVHDVEAAVTGAMPVASC